MGSASRYWRLVRLDSAGKYRIASLATAEAFFKEQFPALEDTQGVDIAIQRHLVQLLRAQPPAPHRTDAAIAELCLRCFISEQILQVCLKLEAQFGERHGFTRYDLLPYVLNDPGEIRQEQSSSGAYKAFAIEVLQSFNPDRSNLSTWTTRLVRYHPDVNSFLIERGIYLISDWAMLNDTNGKQLQRILSEFHHLTPEEIDRACQLLESYHLIYRRDRLQQRQAGTKRHCVPPTPAQLQQMAQWLQGQGIDWKPSHLANQLHALADRLREYRVYVRGGFRTTESLEDATTRSLLETLPAPQSEAEQENDPNEFLQFYRQQFLTCLEAAVTQVTRDRVLKLQRKNDQKATQFLTALHLFHCQGKSMGEIAQAIGLQAQYQVTRLLNLKPYRADIRQEVLVHLRDRVLEQAKQYASPDRLKTLDQQIQTALEEQVEGVFQEAEAEASTPKNRPVTSLFARKLCDHLGRQPSAS